MNETLICLQILKLLKTPVWFLNKLIEKFLNKLIEVLKSPGDIMTLND